MPSSPRRILIVDDDPDLTCELAELLQCDGHDVREAHCPATARAGFARWAPDVVLLDFMLGDFPALELAREWAGAAVPPRVILVTGVEPSEVRRHHDARWLAAILRKPLDPDALAPLLAPE